MAKPIRVNRSWLLATFACCLALLALQVSAVTTQDVPAGTACTQPRVRKSWESYTTAEKTTYKNALQLAMKSGLHMKFVQMHVEWFSEFEAHKNCMFIYWHRMYLLGYENMLRSLGSGYECVTLPVWDHLSATARRTAGSCSNMEACAPIVSDFGGSTVGSYINLKIYNVTIPYKTSWSTARCVNKAPLSSFCSNNTQCAGCILRGPVSTTSYPGEAYFGSVYNQVFGYDTWDDFRLAVEGGVHNSIHSNLGGIMMYFQSPIDPLFYAHHSFVDALQTIYLKCELGNATATLSADAKGSDSRFWSSCARRSSGYYTSNDSVHMWVQDYSNGWGQVTTTPKNLLYTYFKDLPKTFAEYIDAKDLGVYSYTYNLSGALSNMFTNCRASNTISSATSLLASDGEAGDAMPNEGLEEDSEDRKAHHWAIVLFESARLNGYTKAAAEEQMEMVTCMHRHECIGDVQDFDPVFRANFKVEGHPRCFTLVKALESGEKVIGIPRWRQITSHFIPCLHPKKPKHEESVSSTLQ